MPIPQDSLPQTTSTHQPHHERDSQLDSILLTMCPSQFTVPHPAIRQLNSSKFFKCTDGCFWPLKETVLPLPNLKAIAYLLPFIDVPSPTDSRWLQLEYFGVIVKETLELYLRQLKAFAKRTGPSPVNIPELQIIYRQIEYRSLDNEHIIR